MGHTWRRADGRASGRAGPGAVALLGAVLAAVLAACGTRLPDSAFQPPSTAAPATSPATAGPGGATAVSNPATTGTPGTSTSAAVGVTPSTIKLGLVVSRTSPLGAETFSGPMYGAQAFVRAINASGGVNGRHVDLVVCDDGATGAGNRRCVTSLVETEKVFAFVSNSIYDYAGASYVNDHGVPDVGGLPIDTAYDQYRHLWSIYGSSSPRDGTVGLNGKLYGGTEVYRWFKESLGARTAGVVAYNQSDSLRFANLTASALALEGYTVVREQLDFAVPGWDAAAIDMKARGVDIVFDALDGSGNVSLCRAMESAGLAVKAKAVTVQAWSDSVRTDYTNAPTCRNELYATATTRNYMDTDQPTIARFRTEMLQAFPDREAKMSMWELEGWAGALWLTDAMTSCGADLTRSCVEGYLGRAEPYDGHGVLTARDFVARTAPEPTAHNCLFVARWRDDAYDGHGGWVTTTADKEAACFDVPNVAYTP